VLAAGWLGLALSFLKHTTLVGWAKVLLKQYRATLGPPPMAAKDSGDCPTWSRTAGELAGRSWRHWLCRGRHRRQA
jgi:hypothetical protein